MLLSSEQTRNVCICLGWDASIFHPACRIMVLLLSTILTSIVNVDQIHNIQERHLSPFAPLVLTLLI